MSALIPNNPFAAKQQKVALDRFNEVVRELGGRGFPAEVIASALLIHALAALTICHGDDLEAAKRWAVTYVEATT